jgi:predicted nucleotidyltransferase
MRSRFGVEVLQEGFGRTLGDRMEATATSYDVRVKDVGVFDWEVSAMTMESMTTAAVPMDSQTMPIAELLQARLGVDVLKIVALCDRFRIVEFGLFGSVLRDDFRLAGSDPSDVDVLVVFETDYRLSWETWRDLQEGLERLFGRKVDVVRKELLTNPYRRAEILRTYRVIYAKP